LLAASCGIHCLTLGGFDVAMKIRNKTWRRYTRVGSILILPIAVILFIRPNFGAWNDTVWYGGLALMFLFAGSGALLAILMRAGVIQLTYSDEQRWSRVSTVDIPTAIMRILALSRRSNRSQMINQPPNNSPEPTPMVTASPPSRLTVWAARLSFGR
jgi:hypothetical protein